MIGFSALVVEFMRLVIPLFILWVISRINRSDARRALWVVGVITTLFGIASWLAVFSGVKNRRILRQIRADEIAQMQIGVMDVPTRELVPLVAALNDCRLFSENHGGHSNGANMVVRLKNGEVLRYSITSYERERGIVLRRDQRLCKRDVFVPDPTGLFREQLISGMN